MFVFCGIQARLSLELQRDSHVKQQRLIEEKWKRSRREAKPRVLLPASSSATNADQQQQCPHLSASQLPLSPALDPTQVPEGEYDTWLYLLKHKGTPRGAPDTCPTGSKAQKDDKTRLEEQETTIVQLRRLVDNLLGENEQVKRDNDTLRAENERLRRRERERERELERERERNNPEEPDDADFVERSDLWVLPRQPSAEERKAKDIPIPQLPPLEMPTQEIPLEDLPSLELPEDIQHELQEILDGEKL